MSGPNGWRSMFGGGGPSSAASPMPNPPFGAMPLGIPSSGGSVSPTTGPGGINAGQLQPDNREANMDAGVPYQLVPAYPPFVRLANDPRIVYFPRFRTIIFGGGTVAAAIQNTQSYLFSVPTIILARTGAAILADDTDAPVGRAPLDLIKVQFFRGGATSDLIDSGSGTGSGTSATTLVLGSAVLGTGAQPALIQGNGLFMDNGMFLQVACQTLIDNVEAHVTIWCLEEFGPSRG